MVLFRTTCFILLFFCTACIRKPESKTIKQAAAKIEGLYISRNDFGIKSICLDSSGFYYLCNDENAGASSHKQKRIELSGYKDELQLFQSMDTAYFAKLDKAVGISCGVAKEPLAVTVKQNGGEFQYHPAVCAAFNSESYFYKIKLVRDFFLQLKKDYPENS